MEYLEPKVLIKKPLEWALMHCFLEFATKNNSLSFRTHYHAIQNWLEKHYDFKPHRTTIWRTMKELKTRKIITWTCKNSGLVIKIDEKTCKFFLNLGKILQKTSNSIKFQESKKEISLKKKHELDIKLKQIENLYKKGYLTKEQYEQHKAKIEALYAKS